MRDLHTSADIVPACARLMGNDDLLDRIDKDSQFRSAFGGHMFKY